MSAALTRTIAAKEARALLPTWSAGVLAATIAAVTVRDFHQFSRFAFAAATVALGAQAIGHEYAHRTIGLMLTLPIDRRRLFLLKLGVAAALVLTLVAYAAWLGILLVPPQLPWWILAAVALGLAPLLTMACRSQLAGTIFSLSLPWMVLIVVVLVAGTALDASADVERTALAAWSRLMGPMLIVGAALGWRLFMRLESIDGAAGLHIGWSIARREARRSHPVWQLVKKECRLQQMAFAVAVLYLVGSAMAVGLDVPGPGGVSVVGATTVVYGLGLPVLIGALATAEERQLGTIAWQLQLPMSARRQWAVKVAVVFGLAWLLTIAVPRVVVPWLWPGQVLLGQLSIGMLLVLTAVGLYVSSLSAATVRAMVASVVAVWFVLWLAAVFEMRMRGSGALLMLTVWSAVSVPLVAFAFVNHRPEPPSVGRVVRQAVALVVIATGWLAIAIVWR